MLTGRIVLRSIADLALPRSCAVCGRALNIGEDIICLPCRADLPFTRFWELPHNPMADAFNARIARALPEASDIRYCHAVALVYYRSGSDYISIPRRLKYWRDFKEGRYFAQMLGERLASAPEFQDVDTVVPIPLHWSRKRKRGYNQAEVIASVLARCLPGARMVNDMVRRTRSTGTQTGLEGEAKLSNVSGAFSCTRAARSILPRHILLVDDVFTSGATTVECFLTLYKQYGGGTRISVATLSYVQKD